MTGRDLLWLNLGAWTPLGAAVVLHLVVQRRHARQETAPS